MNITHNLTLKEKTAIHSNALSLDESDRGNMERQCNNGLKKIRMKMSTSGQPLTIEEERDFMANIEFSTMCYAIDANKEGLFGNEFRERARIALIAHYTSPLLSYSQLPIMSNQPSI